MVEHAWLTTLRRDGSPRTVRVWFVFLGEAVWVATSEPSRKVADLRRDPRVTLAIEGRHDAIRGTATLEPIDNGPVLRSFAENYGGWDAADPNPYGPRVLICISSRSD